MCTLFAAEKETSEVELWDCENWNMPDCGGGGGVCCGRMVHVTVLLAFLLPGLGEYI